MDWTPPKTTPEGLAYVRAFIRAGFPWWSERLLLLNSTALMSGRVWVSPTPSRIASNPDFPRAAKENAHD